MISNEVFDESCVTIDFGDVTLEQLNAVVVSNLDRLVVFLPLPSIGRTNSHRDIAEDLRDASFAAEMLAKYSNSAKAEHDYPNRYDTRLKLTLQSPDKTIKSAFKDCYLTLRGCSECPELQEQFDDVWSRVHDYEDDLGTYDPFVPEIVESYFANLINGAYYELRSEAPDYYNEQIKLYPERQVDFHRSPYSSRIGADCYASADGWLVPANTNLDHFFKVTDQSYKSADFVSGEIFTIEGKSFVRTESQLLYFPMSHYFRSRACASLLFSDDDWPPDHFSWSDAAFTHSPYVEHMRSLIPGELRAPSPDREKCIVHDAGGLICVNDGKNLHLLYGTKTLTLHQTKNILAHVNELSAKLESYVGLSGTVSCDWKSLDDEKFEELCYDIIYSHPRFNAETIKKMGKSRSRDGGRDIVVYENPRSFDEKPKKWVFQCKLIRDNSSLSSSRLLDVGDMLEQYDADGFGVMTSSFIDATLYDKLEKICIRRAVEEMHFSVFELERFLSRHNKIKERCFSS